MQTTAETPLRVARKSRGLGLRQAARLADLDPGHLSKVERGYESLSVASLRRLALALGVDPGWLLDQVAGTGGEAA